ncbi:hypothetical protein [Helicobacter apodemus]|nr:hypothetical protein [Helicobacter apodemus]
MILNPSLLEVVSVEIVGFSQIIELWSYNIQDIPLNKGDRIMPFSHGRYE